MADLHIGDSVKIAITAAAQLGVDSLQAGCDGRCWRSAVTPDRDIRAEDMQVARAQAEANVHPACVTFLDAMLVLTTVQRHRVALVLPVAIRDRANAHPE